MFLKCKPEKVSETIKAAIELFENSDVSVESVSMSAESFDGLFGEGQSKVRREMAISGIPVKLDDSAREFAVLNLSVADPEPTPEKTEKKAKK